MFNWVKPKKESELLQALRLAVQDPSRWELSARAWGRHLTDTKTGQVWNIERDSWSNYALLLPVVFDQEEEQQAGQLLWNLAESIILYQQQQAELAARVGIEDRYNEVLEKYKEGV